MHAIYHKNKQFTRKRVLQFIYLKKNRREHRKNKEIKEEKYGRWRGEKGVGHCKLRWVLRLSGTLGSPRPLPNPILLRLEHKRILKKEHNTKQPYLSWLQYDKTILWCKQLHFIIV